MEAGMIPIIISPKDPLRTLSFLSTILDSVGFEFLVSKGGTLFLGDPASVPLKYRLPPPPRHSRVLVSRDWQTRRGVTILAGTLPEPWTLIIRRQ